MTESQLALKQILDQWTACTLSIEDAETALLAWVSQYAIPVKQSGTWSELTPGPDVTLPRIGDPFPQKPLTLNDIAGLAEQTEKMLSAVDDAVWRKMIENGKAINEELAKMAGRAAMHAWTEREQFRAEDAMERRDAKQVVFLEQTHNMTGNIRERFYEQWKALLGERYEVVLLPAGVTVANQQEWRPERVDIECGSISIKTKSKVGTLFGAEIVIDGVQMTRVSSISIDMNCRDTSRVKIEFVP